VKRDPRESDPRTGGRFLRMIEIDAAQAAEQPDTFDRLRGGDLHGALIHNLYTPDVLARVVERLNGTTLPSC